MQTANPTPARNSLLSRFVRAALGIDAGIGQAQALHGLAAHDVRFDNFVDVSQADAAIPYTFGIDHKIRPVLALIEASGLIGPHFTLESTLGQLLLEEFLQLGIACRIAATSRMPIRTLVSANKDVPFKGGHENNVHP